MLCRQCCIAWSVFFSRLVLGRFFSDSVRLQLLVLRALPLGCSDEMWRGVTTFGLVGVAPVRCDAQACGRRPPMPLRKAAVACVFGEARLQAPNSASPRVFPPASPPSHVRHCVRRQASGGQCDSYAWTASQQGRRGARLVSVCPVVWPGGKNTCCTGHRPTRPWKWAARAQRFAATVRITQHNVRIHHPENAPSTKRQSSTWLWWKVGFDYHVATCCVAVVAASQGGFLFQGY